MSGSYSFPLLFGLLAKKPTKLSQAMHNAAFKARGISAVYVAFDTEDTFAAVSAMRSLGIKGYSLTIPHKEKVIPLVDELSPEAKQISAVNTLVNSDGRLIGYNTDFLGILRAFEEKSISISKKNVMIYGGGGAAKAAVFAFLKAGADKVCCCIRDAKKVLELEKDLGVSVVTSDTLTSSLLGDVNILVNATPVGSILDSASQPRFPVDITKLSANSIVFDMVTRDTWLMDAAKKQGLQVVAGERMLLFQAIEQFKLFTGTQNAPVSEMEAALRAAART